jgi:hypothetical protein
MFLLLLLGREGLHYWLLKRYKEDYDQGGIQIGLNSQFLARWKLRIHLLICLYIPTELQQP